ncbi:MAG TPA: D-2-hydroxyacid dehydrogenase, partial [Roseiflexaceae bacterium]|nr:D-2-hydroxyacid dehydrogenase [Roseiflexaceae bacterium]
MIDQPSYTLLIASYLEPEYVARIRAVSPRLNVVYEPDLLAPPRYHADHYNQIDRTPEQEARWRELLGQAEILFDFDYTHRQDLPDLAPNLRWLQSSSAGIGQFIRRAAYDRRLPNTIFTTGSGVHARPLADFCLMAMLYFAKGLNRIIDNQRRKHWERYAGTELGGRTLAIVGAGKIGAEAARLARAMGMTVLGVKRNPAGVDPASLNLHELYGPDRLGDVLRRAEYLVLIAPHTDETEHMIGATELALMPAGAVLINIGRGQLIDEPALIAALQSGHLGGAALDVFAEEPLPQN